MLSKTKEGSFWKISKFPPPVFQSDVQVLMTADEKISVGWYLCLAGYRGLLAIG